MKNELVTAKCGHEVSASLSADGQFLHVPDCCESCDDELDLGTSLDQVTKWLPERNVCRKRKSFHVFEIDKKTGDYTVEVYDPLASVISYLRDAKWFATHTAKIDSERISGLNIAIDVCVFNYNTR